MEKIIGKEKPWWIKSWLTRYIYTRTYLVNRMIQGTYHIEHIQELTWACQCPKGRNHVEEN